MALAVSLCIMYSQLIGRGVQVGDVFYLIGIASRFYTRSVLLYQQLPGTMSAWKDDRFMGHWDGMQLCAAHIGVLFGSINLNSGP